MGLIWVLRAKARASPFLALCSDAGAWHLLSATP
jgi:hypothetical protein